MNSKNLKTKLIARVMLLVLLLGGAVSFAGCGIFEEDPFILDKEIPNLENQSISYLLIRDLSCSEDVMDIDYYYYSIKGGFEIRNGESQYEPAIIEASAGFDGNGLDKKSFSWYLVKESSISIMGNFYPVKGDIGDLEYEFKYVDSSPYKYHKAVYIYSNSQLLGKVYYDASKAVQKEWIT